MVQEGSLQEIDPFEHDHIHLLEVEGVTPIRLGRLLSKVHPHASRPMSLEWHNQLLEHLLEANGMMVEMFRRSGCVKPPGRKIEPAIHIDPSSMNARFL